jgi:hypothetical protein
VHCAGRSSSAKLNLHGIDSTENCEDVLELCTWHDAKPETQQLLLDSCLDGFLNQLVQAKWRRFGKILHYITLALALTLLVLQTRMGHRLKGAPEQADRLVTPSLMLAVLAVLLWYEGYTIVLWWWNKDLHENVSRWNAIRELLIWINDVQIPLEILCYLMQVIVCIALIANDEPPYEHDENILSLLALSTFGNGLCVMRAFVMPFQSLGIFSLCVERVLSHDVHPPVPNLA